MNKKPRMTASGILPLLLSGLLILFLASCGEGPTKLDVKESNAPPETVITAKTLSKIALETDSTGAFTNLNDFNFTVEYTGSDQDGTVDSFSVRVDGGAWTAFTEKRTFKGTLQLISTTDVHKVEVRAKDNEGGIDPTPAEASLSLQEVIANKPPTTAFVSGPTNGATTGGGVKFGFSGTDEDGTVAKFFYSLDGGADVEVAADAEGKGEIEFSKALANLLDKGTHSVSVYSQDNLGAKDPTPATVSFFVTTGFKPLLTQTGGPPPGGGWFTGANIPFAWSASTGHYAGVIDRFEFSIDDPVNFSSTASPGVSLDPQTAGPHIFRLKAVDTGGNESEVLEVGFDVAEFAPTEGILLLDNVSFTPGGGPYTSEPQMDQMILDGFFKNFTKVSVWDVDRLSGSRRFPGAINDKARPGPADLAKYSSIVIMTDGGAGASIDPRTDAALYAAYFQAGGNVMVTGYNAVGFGQVLKDVLGARVFNGFGSDNYQSLEGFQTADDPNSDAYALITGSDVVPVIPGVGPRSWEIIFQSGDAKRILFANVGSNDTRQGFSIATEIQGVKGNWGIWIGVSLFYMDQTSTGIVKFGDFVLGTRFGEM